MNRPEAEPVAIVGISAIMPEAPDAAAFWTNITDGRYCISDVPSDRWDPHLYFDPNPRAPDKTYSRIGGWVRQFDWDPLRWKLPIPPAVAAQFDDGQKWSVAGARAALMDAGWPDWNVDPERVAVIIGNAIGGEKHYESNMRIEYPRFTSHLRAAPSFGSLPESVQLAILAETKKTYKADFTEITEDSMPGELANIIAGRVANVFNFRGPNFTTDAACASGLAAMFTAVRGLQAHDFDAAVSGGVDRNMNVAAFVKFCKIGALSATGTRPFDAGADGFVMGEGAALFVLKRLSDAEAAGDRIYAVLLGIAGSSDGKGKGITAPNPVGQKLAVARAWRDADLDPALATLIEAHGTSTRVGDAVELESLDHVFHDAKPGTIGLGSVKSNIGHLKAAAGAAGLFKMVMSLHEKVMPPSLHFVDPNPNVDWGRTAFRVNTALTEWSRPAGGIRYGGVSAFGFGGTNFHVVLSDYEPGRHRPPGEARSFAGEDIPRGTERASTTDMTAAAAATVASVTSRIGPPSGQASGTAPRKAPDAPSGQAAATAPRKAPLRGAAVVGGRDEEDVARQLDALAARAKAGQAPAPAAPDPALAGAAVRVAIDYGDAAELADKATKAVKALRPYNPAMWRMLRAQGVFLGRGRPGKVAFLYTGQGSQYVNMLRSLTGVEPMVAEDFANADQIMKPLLGRPLTSYIFVDGKDNVAAAEMQLLQTEITQPAVLTADLALTRLLDAYGVRPDMVMGHSLGEYGALVAAGALSFAGALEAVSARGREMASLSMADNGAMLAVFGPLEKIERIVSEVDGYAVLANINSTGQAVVGGATRAVEKAAEAFQAAGLNAARLPVSHAFHTSIVAPASEPLKKALRRLDLHPPVLPIVSNVTGKFYPSNSTVDTMLDLLGQQVASPVQFVSGLRTLYDAGARIFVEVGPKKALHGFVEDVLGKAHDDVLALFTNHPKAGDVVSFNQALCGLYAAGLGLATHTAPSAAPVSTAPAAVAPVAAATAPARAATAPAPAVTAVAKTNPGTVPAAAAAVPSTSSARTTMTSDRYAELGRLFADVLEQGMRVYAGGSPEPHGAGGTPLATEPVVITGAALGLPGVPRVFDDENIGRILNGQQFIDTIPHKFRRAMVDHHITRLVKRESGDPTFEVIEDEADVIKLAGRGAPVDTVAEFGLDAARDEALDEVTRLAIGAGFDALRDAGIPLVMRYKQTTLGTSLPDRWGLPEALRDDTGVIFASAFPGYDAFARDLEGYFVDRGRREQLAALEAVRARMRDGDTAVAEVDNRIGQLRHLLSTEPYSFDRRFLFRVLSMGHSQFAEIIGARGPNTQINAACASTTQAVCLAEDWIRTGRARRVVIVSADDVTSDALLTWVASGFLASGAAATDDVVEDAATPFDRRRHGMIIGMGAAAIMVESAEAARERGIQPICEVAGAVTANSAFHGTRLDVSHIGQVMEQLMRQAEARGLDRHAIAAETVFVSHETYTPARGGSASAEVESLRRTFGGDADQIVVTNTKGFTGHAMGAGVEDVVAIKSLETGLVPAVPNFKEPDPDLGPLNLSAGGAYPVRYALRLAAGFGSQVAMSLLRWTPVPDGRRRAPDELGYAYRIVDEAAWRRWLSGISGQDDPLTEVVQRKLRVVDRPPSRTPAAPAPAERPVSPVPVTSAPTPVAPAPVAPAPVSPAPVAPAAAVAPAAPAAPPVEEPATAVTDPIAEQITGIVSGLTGYPPELLDPDLDLEADLGVDTVKQAEVFAAVRERFGVPRDDNLRLRDFPTLNHVAGWIRERTGVPTPAATAPAVTAPVAPAVQPAAPAAPPVEEPATAVTDPIAEQITGIVSGLTGYPPELLDPDLDLEADLGVDTVKQAEVFAAVRERFGVPRDDNLRLRDFPTINHVIGWIRERTGAPAPAAPQAAAAAPAVTAPAAEPAAPEPAAPAPADEMASVITGIVADLTGYPPELLDPTLDLEADLGVDTVKQAEVFAAVRERYGVARDDNLKLRDFPTINHVIAWIRERTGAPAPAAVPAQATPAEAAAGTAAAPVDEVATVVTDIVARLTGYPAELLDADLDLEADLGVDTVKQAEIFAAVRERFGVARDDNLKLRDFPTINHVIGWIRERTGAPAAVPTQETPPAAATATQGAPAEATADTRAPAAVHAAVPVTGDLAATDRLPRRVPVPVLRPALNLCVPTGVELTAGTRVVVMPDRGGVGEALDARLRRLGVSTLVLAPGTGTDELVEQVTGYASAGPVHGVYWLPALDDEGELTELDLAAWREALRQRVGALYAVMRALYERSPFLVTGTRLGGYHGYDAAGATNPMGGAVTGFAKAYRKERPDAVVKAVDVPRSRKTAALAELLVDETLRDPGCVEIGHADGLRWGVGLEERPFGDGTGAMVLGPDSAFLVTGAAGSIVSAITADLAAASHGTFHLLDLTPAPDPADPELRRFVEDRDGLKVEIAGRMRERGERPTPVAIDRELARLERLAAALAAIQAVEAAGGTAHYHQVDLTDADAVAAAVAGVREISGKVDVLLHAAGLEISRALPDKSPAEFNLVLGVKADGWHNIMRAARDLPIGATVVFSSVAGRFGNSGQTDYSSANDLLCKITSSLRRTRPDTRAIALDWTAWGGIGMATRGSIPKIMEMAGVQMLPPEAGVAWIRRELTASGDRGEVVVAGTLGQMATEYHETGGLDPAALGADGSGPMLGEVAFSVHDGLVVRITLDPAAQPFLNHHRIDGTPVLPGVMAMEAFAEAARLLAPEWTVADVENVDFLAPLKFYRDEPRTLTLTVLAHPDGDDLLADCRLSAERLLPGATVAQRTTHTTGTVRLSRQAPQAEKMPVPRRKKSAVPAVPAATVYQFYFHGPAYQVVDTAWKEDGAAAGRLAVDLPANHEPPALPTVLGPRLVELCFQVAGLWQAGNDGVLALPAHVDRVSLRAEPAEGAGLVAVARPEGDGFDCAVRDEKGRVLVRLTGYRTVALPQPLPDEVRDPLRTVFGE